MRVYPQIFRQWTCLYTNLTNFTSRTDFVNICFLCRFQLSCDFLLDVNQFMSLRQLKMEIVCNIVAIATLNKR